MTNSFPILMYRQPNLTLPVNRSRSKFVELESLMQHAMFQDHRTLGSAEDFAIYGHDSHLGHVSKTILHKNHVPSFQEGSTKGLALIGQAVTGKAV